MNTTTKILLVFCVLFTAGVAFLSADTSNCDDGWTYLNRTSSCYIVLHNKNYSEAEKECLGLGSHLVSIHSNYENTSSLNDFTNWAPGQPDNFLNDENCVQLFSDENIACCGIKENWPKFKWNDFGCREVMRNLVCKKPVLDRQYIVIP